MCIWVCTLIDVTDSNEADGATTPEYRRVRSERYRVGVPRTGRLLEVLVITLGGSEVGGRVRRERGQIDRIARSVGDRGVLEQVGQRLVPAYVGDQRGKIARLHHLGGEVLRRHLVALRLPD